MVFRGQICSSTKLTKLCKCLPVQHFIMGPDRGLEESNGMQQRIWHTLLLLVVRASVLVLFDVLEGCLMFFLE